MLRTCLASLFARGVGPLDPACAETTGKRKAWILNPLPQANERWRVAIAGLVAALAIPFLVIDTPGTAEGIETVDAPVLDEASDANESLESASAPDPIETPAAVEVVVVEEKVSPDIAQLALRASMWSAARTEAVADGLVEVRPPAPSNTDLSLLPTIPVVAAEPVAETDDDAITGDSAAGDSVTDESATENLDSDTSGDADATEDVADVDASAEPEDGAAEQAPLVDTEPAQEPEAPATEELVAEETGPSSPPAPARVDGRVPPPPGGPTAAQWDALRACESTHNYAAINHTGTYRGAYQFSQQTWDWVAGIHQPHLVGVDPATADPAWQDIMAYTLYAMRGWDQWPICGQHLL